MSESLSQFPTDSCCLQRPIKWWWHLHVDSARTLTETFQAHLDTLGETSKSTQEGRFREFLLKVLSDLKNDCNAKKSDETYFVVPGKDRPAVIWKAGNSYSWVVFLTTSETERSLKLVDGLNNGVRSYFEPVLVKSPNNLARVNYGTATQLSERDEENMTRELSSALLGIVAK